MTQRFTLFVVMILVGVSVAQPVPVDEYVPAEAPTISVDVRLSLQFRYTASFAPDAPDPIDDPAIGFSFRRLRPKVVFETDDGLLKGVFQAEGRSSSGLKVVDAYMTYALEGGYRLRFGQFDPAFDRESMVSSTKQLAVERSESANTLNPNATDRVQGIELRYGGEKDRAYFTFSEGFSRQNTAFNDSASGWGFTVRYERLLIGDSFKQMKQFTAPRGSPRALMFGIAGHVQGMQGGGDRAAWTADLSFQDNGFNALLKSTGHSAEDRNIGLNPDPESAYGVLGQMGYYVTETVEPFVRYEWATTSDETHPDLNAVTVGFNWYIMGQALRVVTDFTVAFDGVGPAFDRTRDGLILTPSPADRFVFRTQIQMLF